MASSISQKTLESHKTKCLLFIIIGLTFFLALLPSHVAATDTITISRGEPFQISATVLTNGTFGEPILQQLVEFYDERFNQFIGASVTNEQGIATLEYEFPISYPKGYTLINATFRGNESLALAPSCQWISLVVTSFSYLDLQIVKTNLAPDETLVFSFTLFDDSENPIENASLEVLCDSILVCDVATNKTGQTIVNINLKNSSIGLGSHSIEVIYEGNLTYYYRGVSASFDFEVRRLETSIQSLTPTPETISLNQTSIIVVDLTSIEGNPINASLQILIDGITIENTITNSTGIAEFSIHFNESYSIGSHNLEISYSGNFKYEPTNLVIPFILNTDINLETTYLSRAIINTNVSINLRISDVFTRPIPHLIVQLIDLSNNNSISIEAFYEKEVSLELLLTGHVGNRTIQILIDGEYISYKNDNTLTIGVWTSPEILLLSSSIFGYASPNQKITINFHLANQLGNLSSRGITCSILGTVSNSSTMTNQFGNAIIEVIAPEAEGSYILLIEFIGNEDVFELSGMYTYIFRVSKKMPVEILDFRYEVNHITKLIVTRLQIVGLNGSNIVGVPLEFLWLGQIRLEISSFGGIVQFELPLPILSGIYDLECYISSTNYIESYSCIFHVVITPVDSNSTEGIGFYPLILGLTGSFGIPFIPLMKRKSVVK